MKGEMTMTTLKANTRPVPATGQWIILGALAAMLAAAAVLTVLALAVAFWPDIALFKPLLARGELRMVGATTLDEYREHIEKDPALERLSLIHI